MDEPPQGGSRDPDIHPRAAGHSSTRRRRVSGPWTSVSGRGLRALHEISRISRRAESGTPAAILVAVTGFGPSLSGRCTDGGRWHPTQRTKANRTRAEESREWLRLRSGALPPAIPQPASGSSCARTPQLPLPSSAGLDFAPPNALKRHHFSASAPPRARPYPCSLPGSRKPQILRARFIKMSQA